MNHDDTARIPRPILRVHHVTPCAVCGVSRHPTSAHYVLGSALDAAKRALRSGRVTEGEAFVDVARRLAREGRS